MNNDDERDFVEERANEHAMKREAFKERLFEIDEEIEEVRWQIDEAAEADEGDEWESLNDRLEELEAEAEAIVTNIRQLDAVGYISTQDPEQIGRAEKGDQVVDVFTLDRLPDDEPGPVLVKVEAHRVNAYWRTSDLMSRLPDTSERPIDDVERAMAWMLGESAELAEAKFGEEW